MCEIQCVNYAYKICIKSRTIKLSWSKSNFFTRTPRMDSESIKIEPTRYNKINPFYPNNQLCKDTNISDSMAPPRQRKNRNTSIHKNHAHYQKSVDNRPQHSEDPRFCHLNLSAPEWPPKVRGPKEPPVATIVLRIALKT